MTRCHTVVGSISKSPCAARVKIVARKKALSLVKSSKRVTRHSVKVDTRYIDGAMVSEFACSDDVDSCAKCLSLFASALVADYWRTKRPLVYGLR